MMKSALLLLDLQNDMVDPAGKIGAHGLAQAAADGGVLDNAARALALARESDVAVIHVRLAFRSDYADSLSRAPRIDTLKANRAAIFGEWGAEFAPAVQPIGGELVVNKQGVNAFFNTGLLSWLGRHGIERTFIGGVATHLAVEHAVRAGDDAGFFVVALSDCCAAPSPALHEYSIEKIMPAFGKVISVHEMAAMIG